MIELEKKLSRIDLNLLVSLNVLLKTRNVSRAAEELYLSQSAMSRTLQRLRDTFEDTLFHRSSRGIVPTARALEIEKLLSVVLSDIESIIEKENFDPETSDKLFHISVPPLLSPTITLPLISLFAEKAPNIRFHEYPSFLKPSAELESGKLDFAFHIDRPSDEFVDSRKLGTITPIVYARNEHPIKALETCSIDDCLEYDFAELLIDTAKEHPMNRLLIDDPHKLRVFHRSSQLSSVINIVENSNCMMIGGQINQIKSAFSNNIDEVLKIKIPKRRELNLYLLSHERTFNSDAHEWLRKEIIQLFEDA